MSWYNYLLLSNEILRLESSLKPQVREHNEGMKSTAYTEVDKKLIHLDISQPPLKCALSYAYELKNLENAKKYETLNENARKNLITKQEYIKNVLQLEAEAVYYRCQVFRQLGAHENDFPCRKEYLNIYDSANDSEKEETIKKIALFIQENGVVKREYAAKKYYADCYDFYAGKKSWPNFYEEQRSKTVLILDDDTLKNSLPKP